MLVRFWLCIRPKSAKDFNRLPPSKIHKMAREANSCYNDRKWLRTPDNGNGTPEWFAREMGALKDRSNAEVPEVKPRSKAPKSDRQKNRFMHYLLEAQQLGRGAQEAEECGDPPLDQSIVEGIRALLARYEKELQTA